MILKTETQHVIDPVLFFRWDIPSMMFIAKNVAKTYKVSLGIEIAY